jgi:2-polyprenyl-3-methyl-5-hydroxy-6-metoxy-1,4-benzoquinol methylase
MKRLYLSQRYLVDVGQCQECGLIGMQNPPSEDALREMYSDENMSLGFAALTKSNKVNDRHQRAIADIKNVLGVSDNRSSTSALCLLDIGAGSGAFLNEAREAGFDISGNELSTSAIQMAWDQYGIRLDSDDLNKDQRDGYFDAVTMWGLLEHVRKPMDVLVEATRLLRSGGVLYIYTPAWCLYDKIGLMSALALHWTRLMDRRISTQHLQLFHRTTLEWACKRVGLQVHRFEVVCEYNLPVAEYLESLGIPSRVRNIFGWAVEQLIDRNLFFRNNSRVFCLKR